MAAVLLGTIPSKSSSLLHCPSSSSSCRVPVFDGHGCEALRGSGSTAGDSSTRGRPRPLLLPPRCRGDLLRRLCGRCRPATTPRRDWSRSARSSLRRRRGLPPTARPFSPRGSRQRRARTTAATPARPPIHSFFFCSSSSVARVSIMEEGGTAARATTTHSVASLPRLAGRGRFPGVRARGTP